jgi:hypothetical protein
MSQSFKVVKLFAAPIPKGIMGAAMHQDLFSKDTTRDAAEAQFDAFKRMQPHQRLKVALEMSTSLRNTVVSGVRSRHPDYTLEQVTLAVSRLMLGDQLFGEVCPGVDIQV